ncbi:homeobox protein CDX-4 [Polypterus senegalus]|uniref:homeobox protein CDX-4 n=1 Tax=Polypterus senegalus TaxID=55291 RepID=UPI001965573B|nr:homeobox protein CDX-4 [Polypterus senegalus]
MYVGYILDKEVNMYHQGPVRRSSINLPAQNYVSTPQYSDYTGYHHVPSMDSHAQSSGAWGTPYGTPREDWGAYGLGPSNSIPTQMNNSSSGQVSYCSSDYNAMHPGGSGILPPPPENITVGQLSPDSERRNSYEWMRKTVQSSSTGKTRTKEKYRVVYTDHQRLELEKEFHYNRYITIRRKSELAENLGLSERQVKIWFQNRRAKERKMIKKKLGQSDGSGGSVHSDPGSVSPLPIPGSLSPADLHGSMYPPPGMNTLQPIGNLQQVTVTQ